MMCYEDCAFCTIIISRNLPCGHIQNNIPCFKPIKPCEYQVKKIIPDCGHSIAIKCKTEPQRKHCNMKYERVLGCGHKCQSMCAKDCTDKLCEEIVYQSNGELACGHKGVYVLCCDKNKGSKYPTKLLGNFIRKRLIDKTAKCFESTEKQGLTPHFSRAKLLDPRCKKVAFGLEQNANDTKAVLITKTTALIGNVLSTELVTQEVDQNEEVNNVCNFLQSRVTNVQSQTTSSAMSLMRQYIRMPHQDFKSNVAMFWN